METLVHPTSAQLSSQDALAAAGTLEIAPIETPLALFIWSRNRIVPVRVTELSITEEAFDPNLNPIRAKVSLTLRALSRRRPRLRATAAAACSWPTSTPRSSSPARAAGATLAAFGVGSLP